MRDTTLPLSHFEAIYDRGPDPWRYASSEYEHAKYAATLAALRRPRYGDAFEVGCSIGVLTAMLAERCDTLLAIEPVATALEAARERNAGAPHVRFASMFVPEQWPDQVFDLVVLSEVLDYLGEADIRRLADRLRTTLRPGGDVVLVHWLGKKRGGAVRPDEASEVLIAATADVLGITHQDRNAHYRLDVLTHKA